MTAWVGTGDGRIFATKSGGATWAVQPYPGDQSPFIDAIWFFDANRGYALGDPAAGNRYVILQTSDGGSSWVHLANEPVGVNNEAGWNNSFWSTDPQHAWFGTNKAKVWRTTDAGVSWQSSASGSANSLSVSFRNNLHGVVGHENGAVLRTTDGGQTWIPIATFTGDAVNGASFLPGTTSAWVSTATTLFHSTDDGASWTEESFYPLAGSIDHISFADTSRGWGVSSFGEVIRYRIPESRPPRPSRGPERYTLYPNFPNPFNGTTSILFDLPVDSRVEVKLYDVLGQLVRTVFSGVQLAGSPRVVCDAAGLASGVYFYRVIAESLAGGQAQFAGIGKMVLIR